MNDKAVNRIGWFASLMAIVMFGSFIDQIRLNLAGIPGSIILPIATVLNCTAWFSYGFFKTERDWPIMICNGFGVILATATAITAAF